MKCNNEDCIDMKNGKCSLDKGTCTSYIGKGDDDDDKYKYRETFRETKK